MDKRRKKVDVLGHICTVLQLTFTMLHSVCACEDIGTFIKGETEYCCPLLHHCLAFLLQPTVPLDLSASSRYPKTQKFSTSDEIFYKCMLFRCLHAIISCERSKTTILSRLTWPIRLFIALWDHGDITDSMCHYWHTTLLQDPLILKAKCIVK